jgi:predicted metal-dependent phosphoesterase TrpH
MIDLHCHTTASDGLLTPHDLIIRAKKEGITVLAIADHDTVDGLAEAMLVAYSNKIYLIPAIELSLDFPTDDLHLLGYGIDYNNMDFINHIEKLKFVRQERIVLIIKRLNKIKIDITVEDVNKESQCAVPGRPHIARVLVKKGYAADVSSAINKYLNKGMSGYVSKEKINPEAAFKLISNAGGVPVLAHPKSMKCIDYREYDRIIKSFISHGLVGIEVYASMHADEDVQIFSNIAQRYNLIATGGSDFHGGNCDRLGYYGDNRAVPVSCAHSILKFIRQRVQVSA